MPQITAPFTAERVAALNAYQHSGRFHPFTCANQHGPLGTETLLVATEAGWVCPACDYTQGWAHEGMADAAGLDPTDHIATEAELRDLFDMEADDDLAATIPTCAGEWRREAPDAWRAWSDPAW